MWSAQPYTLFPKTPKWIKIAYALDLNVVSIQTFSGPMVVMEIPIFSIVNVPKCSHFYKIQLYTNVPVVQCLVQFLPPYTGLQCKRVFNNYWSAHLFN